MKKENIPNALTLVRIALIPVFVVILTFGHSSIMHILAAFILFLSLLSKIPKPQIPPASFEAPLREGKCIGMISSPVLVFPAGPIEVSV